MGRRRKHDGDSGLASDQIPGQNQNNTVSSLVTLYCITTRPFAVIHPCTVAHEESKCTPGSRLTTVIEAVQYAAGLDTGRWENNGTACKLSKCKGDFPRTTRPTCPRPSA